MKLLLLKLKLFLHLVIFLLRLSANISNKTKPLILGIFISGLLLFISGISLLSTSQKPTQVVFTIVPQNTELFELRDMTSDQIKSEIVFWEKIAVMQPKSRDVLLTLSHLYSAINQADIAAKHKKTAISIDPNNPLFK